MKAVQQAGRTSLSARELGALFQSVTESMTGLGGKIGGAIRSQRLEYFTPRDDSPFSVLNDDEPDFSVGAMIPKFGGGRDGTKATLHMYVHDRGSYRDVEFVGLYSFGGKGAAEKAITQIAQAVASQDSAAVIES